MLACADIVSLAHVAQGQYSICATHSFCVDILSLKGGTRPVVMGGHARAKAG